MEIERRHAPVPAELVDYLRANPTAAQQAAEGGVHVHVHHHYAAPAVQENPAPVHQGPEKSIAEKVIPWLYVALLGCIVLTICAVVFAMVAVVVVAILAALVLIALVAAYIIHQHTGALEAKAKLVAAEAKARAKR